MSLMAVYHGPIERIDIGQATYMKYFNDERQRGSFLASNHILRIEKYTTLFYKLESNLSHYGICKGF